MIILSRIVYHYLLHQRDCCNPCYKGVKWYRVSVDIKVVYPCFRRYSCRKALYNRIRYLVSVYRTIGPLVIFYLFIFTYIIIVDGLSKFTELRTINKWYTLYLIHFTFQNQGVSCMHLFLHVFPLSMYLPNITLQH